MDSMHTSELLTIGEAARVLSVSVDTLRRWADAGRIPVVVLPTGHRRFRPEDIDAIREPKAAS